MPFPCFHTDLFLCRDVRRHPVDVYDFEKLFANLEDARSKGLRIVRMGLCLFGDGFGFLNGAKPMSSNGCYISWLNDELTDLSQLDCIGQYPKGLNHMDCWSVWEPDILQIQAGFTVQLTHETVFVCGGIGLIKADQPQAQQFAGCLSQNANYPDRFSNVHKSQLGDLTIDLGAIRKTQQQLREFRSAQKAQPKSAAVKGQLQDAGLCVRPSVFEGRQFQFDVTTQIPPEIYHSLVIGLGGALIRKSLLEMTAKGAEAFVAAFENQPLPPNWNPLVTPKLSTQKDKKLMMGAEDIKHFIQIAPFALRGDILKPARNKSDGRITYTDEAAAKYSKSGQTKLFYNAYCDLAKCYKCVFAKTRKSGSPDADTTSLNELDFSIVASITSLQANWPGEFLTPNVNTVRHLRESTRNYGVASLLNVMLEEMLHGRYKRRAPSTSGRDSLVEVMQYENFRQAAQFLQDILSDLDSARSHPAILRLPESIRSELLNPSDRTLRDLLQPPRVKSPYSASQPNAICDESIRSGPRCGTLKLSAQEKKLIHLQDDDSFPESKVSFIIRPHQDTLWASTSQKGATRYSVTDDSNNRAVIGIVQLEQLFFVGDDAYCTVTWGERKLIDTAYSGCRMYNFSVDNSTNTAMHRRGKGVLSIRHIDRYVHFGLTRDGGMLLNDLYFISS